MSTAANRPDSIPPFAAGTVLGAVDIGSNSIKLTLARQGPDGALEDVARRSEVVRLGAGLAQTGELAQDRMEAAITVLRRFRDEAAALGAAKLIAVATEATRAARNSDEFLARAAAEADIAITIIDGLAEAELSFRGLAATTDIRGSVLVADIGGGSTEFMYALDGDLQHAGSAAVGSGRLTDLFVAHDPPRVNELEACRAAATAGLLALRDQVMPTPGPAPKLLLVGGTGEYLGRMVPDSTRLTPADVGAVLAATTELDAATLAQQLAIPVLRAQVLPAGFAIVGAVVDLAQPVAMTVGQSGIRAGILIDAFAGRWPMIDGYREW